MNTKATPKATKSAKSAKNHPHAATLPNQEITTMMKNHSPSAKPETATLDVAPAATPAPVPTPAAPLVFLQPPPADAKIPTPPSGAASPGGKHYSAVLPKVTELAALEGAIKDLERFTDFAQVLALAGLPYAQVLQAFEVGYAWATMYAATMTWATYCMTQGGIAWTTIRGAMAKLKPLWDVAVAADPSLAATYPNLAMFFGAKSAIAQKAVSTKRLNKAAVANGQPPIHGGVGKRLQRRLEKEALKAGQTAKAAAPPAPEVANAPSPPAATTAPNASGATHG